MNNSTHNDIRATYKSADTEEWLDIHFNRPIGYLWAKLFARLGVHPNVVTLLAIVLGVAAGCMCYYPDPLHTALAIALLIWANHYDSADGQLARMMGKKTLWGRMLDGLAGDIWFFVIYFFVCLRLTPQAIPFGGGQTWGIWIWLVAAYSGFLCHARQCALSDYYRNIHLYFLKGVSGSELDNFKQQRENFYALPWRHNFWWKAFLWFYGNYTRRQERLTPAFQRFLRIANAQPGNEALHTEFLCGSRPLMKFTNILTFNTRAIILFAGLLLDMPWIYFLFEITALEMLYHYMHRRHECLCTRLANKYAAQ